MEQMNKVILIEDDKKKIEDIRAFLKDTYNLTDLVVEESYQSGLRDLITNTYDLLLLDMSIPTWDKSPISTGGNYQKFGGWMILKELIRKNKMIKTILITMFDDFGESDRSITLDQINSLLKSEFADKYLGAVYYSSREVIWKEELKSIIDNSL